LKRSFEVEEADSPTNPSQLSRRNVNPLRSSATSRFHELGSRNSENSSRYGSESSASGQRSPKSSGRRMEFSRRTELSIDISSKQVDNLPSTGINRFGLRRPEVSLHNRITEPPSPRRAGVQDPLASSRRADVPSSTARIPEPVQRKAESPISVESPSALGRRIEPLVNRQVETSSTSRESENNFSSEASISPSITDYKTPPAAQENSSRATE
ncbi:septin-9 isoform X1, partial [Clarias magur]